ncbi:MAG TPA: GT4 family glycosyltransferase PelF [Acidimicrobiales bacterium]|nr:GT4 family glycosyltransferase PelF [Acidimicrobiales bacterium]
MDITLITEGTYPHHLGGVSVWCDQLIREVGEHRFNVLAISSTGEEQDAWALPTNVTSVETVPLWARLPRRGLSRSTRNEFSGVLEVFLRSLSVDNNGESFEASLQELAQFAQAGLLTPAMSSEDAVGSLLALSPVCSERPGRSAARLSVADAVDVLMFLEHFLRPLAVPPPRADLCHATANGLGTLPALAAKWENGTPFLLTEHGVYLRELYLWHKPGALSQPARSVLLRFFKLLIETAYRNADIVAPVCRYNRLWEVANGTPPARIRPVHNGIDPAAFPAATEEPEVPTLVFVGRIDPLKDVETLLRAFAEIRVSIPECRLRLFGPVPEGAEDYMARCARLSADLGLDNGAATFEGKISPPAAAYHAGHVVLLTSISEGLPYVVLEAMASARPVVATDVGGVSEAIGDAGILVPPRDHSAVAAACVRLLLHPSERRALGTAARNRVLQQFTTKRCFGEYRDLYDELAGNQAEIIRLMEPDLLVPEAEEIIELASLALGNDPDEQLLGPEVLV